MRLAAQVKQGFYPVPPEAVRLIASYLRPPDQGPCPLLDPCCGKGDALGLFGELLTRQPGELFACELDERRGPLARKRLAGGTVLCPADFLQTRISGASFSFAWVNPPYDDEIGGGRRVEVTFLLRATNLLATGGVMGLACPERVTFDFDVRRHFLAYYDQVALIPYPEAQQHFNEVVLLARKRKSPRTRAEMGELGWGRFVLPEPVVLTLPSAVGPRHYEKAGPTPHELARLMAESPLLKVFLPPPPRPVPRPALQLSHGQRALVLAGGFLNRVLHKEGQEPVVIKATPWKETYLKEQSTEVVNEGKASEATKEVKTYSERIRLKVRVVTPRGTIHDLE